MLVETRAWSDCTQACMHYDCSYTLIAVLMCYTQQLYGVSFETTMNAACKNDFTSEILHNDMSSGLN